MRICHIMSADLWAGAEVQVAASAAYLVRRPGVSLNAVLLNNGRLATELCRLGVDVTIVDERRHTAPRILSTLTKILREKRPDLVHTHRYKDSVLGAVAAKLAGVPYVVRTVHGLAEPMAGWSRLKFRAYEAVDRATLQCLADLVIGVSKGIADSLAQSGYRPTMLTHIHNGIDLGGMTPIQTAPDVRRELGLDDASLVIGAVGRLAPVKGHASFLEAAKLIVQEEPRARFLLVGNGPLQRHLRAQAAQLGLSGACLFLGDRADVYDIVSAMDVFVLPSLHEGIPMALLEAMALNRPVVATDVGGVPEVLEHRVTGLLVSPGDPRGLADACLNLLANPAWAGRLGQQARHAVESRFTVERSGRELVEAYRSVAAIPKVGASAESRAALAAPSQTAVELARIFVERLARKVRHTTARRQMARLRRRPAPLLHRLKDAQRVLVVCHGNIIRSPFAASLMRAALGDRTRVTVVSAGLHALAGRPPHPAAMAAATGLHLDLSRHETSAVTWEAVAVHDVIFVMDVALLVAIRRRFRDARSKTFLLASMAPSTPLEIRDPVDGDAVVFRDCFDHIAHAVWPIVHALSAQAKRR
jgi:glycosyltransferase involved in cell wall biosynthesis/protein-tyrosine-phosphatase